MDSLISAGEVLLISWVHPHFTDSLTIYSNMLLWNWETILYDFAG